MANKYTDSACGLARRVQLTGKRGESGAHGTWWGWLEFSPERAAKSW